jgi:hypothetical protein
MPGDAAHDPRGIDLLIRNGCVEARDAPANTCGERTPYRAVKKPLVVPKFVNSIMPNFSLVLLLGLFGGSASAGHSLKATVRKPTTQTFFPSNSFQVGRKTTSSTAFHRYLTLSLETFEVGVDNPLSRRDGSFADAASAFVQTQLQVNSSAVKYKSGYSSDITQHAYIKQQHVSTDG